MYTYNVNVTRVVDGDTIIANVDLGFKTWINGLRFRLARIDAPELGSDEGERSKDAMVKHLSGKSCGLTSTGLDKWGRWLCELYIGDHESVNDWMVADGHAKRVSYGEETR